MSKMVMIILIGFHAFGIGFAFLTPFMLQIKSDFITWFPVITFVAMAVLSYLNISMLQRQAKLKEEIVTIIRAEKEDVLDIVRLESKQEIDRLQKVIDRLQESVITKDGLASFEKYLGQLLKTIEMKIDNAATTAKNVEAELKQYRKT